MVAFNIELLGMLSPIFVFILVFFILYAVLMKLKFISDKAGLNGAIAFSMAFLFFLFPFLKEVLMEAIPWVVIVFFCIIIILVILMFMGYEQKSIVKWMEDNSFGGVVTVFVVVIFVGALGKIFSTPEAKSAWSSLEPIKAVILNPKVLGAIVILLIAAKVMHSVGFKE